MSKKIVVLTGSPRKSGNSFAMTEAFIKAAEAKGHTVTRFDTAFMDIGFCHACETCYKTGKPCSYGGDFNDMAPAILEADAVVFSTPVYWYTIPAQLKGAIDKLFSLVVGGKDIAGKECAMIVCCEEEEMEIMDGVRVPLERTAMGRVEHTPSSVPVVIRVFTAHWMAVWNSGLWEAMSLNSVMGRIFARMRAVMSS